jgi:hypothetical protein
MGNQIPELDDVKSELHRKGLSASVRGGGRAIFLLVEREGKAVEISEHEGQWWVEFWEASDDEDAAPAEDRFFPTSGQAVDAVACWLLPCNDGRPDVTSATDQPVIKGGSHQE